MPVGTCTYGLAASRDPDLIADGLEPHNVIKTKDLGASVRSFDDHAIPDTASNDPSPQMSRVTAAAEVMSANC